MPDKQLCILCTGEIPCWFGIILLQSVGFKPAGIPIGQGVSGHAAQVFTFAHVCVCERDRFNDKVPKLLGSKMFKDLLVWLDDLWTSLNQLVPRTQLISWFAPCQVPLGIWRLWIMRWGSQRSTVGARERPVGKTDGGVDSEEWWFFWKIWRWWEVFVCVWVCVFLCVSVSVRECVQYVIVSLVFRS